MTRLDPDLVVKIYRGLIEDLGKASCADVAAIIGSLGEWPHDRKPPTRQAVLLVMKKHPEGRELLDHTKRRTGK